jgi:hypothetical protein
MRVAPRRYGVRAVARQHPGAVVTMRRIALTAAALATAVVLSSCGQDRSTDGFAIVNHSDVDVTVEFTDGLTEVDVAPGHREVVEMPDCLGTAVVVMLDGYPDVHIDGSACTGSVLYVQEDHTAYIESMYA